MNFIDAAVAFLNIGLFSTLVCRFTGANMAILVFAALIYLGCTPLEIMGVMFTYLIFMRLTIYTQKQKLNFKQLQVFKGMKVFIPVLLIVVSLFLYPFAALAIFLFIFTAEILVKMRAQMPKDQLMTTGELMPYIAIGSVMMIIGLIGVSYIPGEYYYILGGAWGLAICFFTWWLGQDRSRMAASWDKVIIVSFIPLAFYGFEIIDWIDDMRRNMNRTNIAYNLPFIFLPVLYVGFLAANLLFGVFSLSGLLITFFGALGLRLFGYYEMSRKGKANVLALGMTILAIFLMFLTNHQAVGVAQVVDAFLPTNTVRFHGIMNMF